jgi:hypothetical protein
MGSTLAPVMFTIIPRRPTQCSVEILVAQFCEIERPPPRQLRIDHVAEPVTVSRWNIIEGASAPPIFWWTGTLNGLSANRLHQVRLMSGEEVLAQARFETLPQSLPRSAFGSGPTRPFTLWLSSCFAARQAQEGLGALVQDLFDSPQLCPHLKCMVGDQVYLDELSWFIYTALGNSRLRARFNRQYACTFTHPAFGPLLSAGGNVFMADDHELWNNYPDSPLGFPLRRQSFWQRWYEFAFLDRCVPLQAPARFESFAIGDELAICFADTRLGRTQDGGRFMTEKQRDDEDAALGNMDRLAEWISSLRCPGVLVTQQPFIVSKGGRANRTLTDYKQYKARLLPALHAAKRDLIVLAGDVHHGSVAVTQLGHSGQGPRLIQVSSSPLALVNPIAAGSPASAPTTFPGPNGPRPVSYPLRVPTYTEGSTTRSEEHAMTIAFWRNKGEDTLGMRVRTWFARGAAEARAPSWETTLSLRPRELAVTGRDARRRTGMGRLLARLWGSTTSLDGRSP